MKLTNQVALKKVEEKDRKLLSKAKVKSTKPQAIQDILNLLVPNREAILKIIEAKKEKAAAEKAAAEKEELVKSEKVNVVVADVVESK